MFIHRGESFGSTGSSSGSTGRKTRVPDIIIREGDPPHYSPLPCIQVTQIKTSVVQKVVDQDDLDDGEYDYLGTSSSNRANRRPSGEMQRPRSPSSPAALKAPGRNSRRVSLIPGEALEQAHASLALSALAQGRDPPSSALFSHHKATSEISEGPREKPRVEKSKTTDDGAGAGDGVDGGTTANSSPLRTKHVPLKIREASSAGSPAMKSNQRWLKLRTTVQLSGALSSSMNRAKPPLKREDSFIKRFSTRQIAELQDTVDQTDEEDISKNSTGSPKIRKKKKKRTPRTVINPYGNVYFYWLCVLTICVLYNLWTTIVRQAFPELQRRPQPMWYLLDGMTDMVFVVDILVQFRTGYLEQGLIVRDFKKLARHYTHSRSFLLDLASLFPLDFLQFIIGSNPIIRFPRFIKVYRVYNYYYMVESRTLYPNMWRVVNLVHILLLLAHWFGCFYYMLSEAEQFRGDWTYPRYQSEDFKTLSRKYLGSVYWSTLTLTTIGDLPTPETNRHDNQSYEDMPHHPVGVDGPPTHQPPFAAHPGDQVTEFPVSPCHPRCPDPGGGGGDGFVKGGGDGDREPTPSPSPPLPPPPLIPPPWPKPISLDYDESSPHDGEQGVSPALRDPFRPSPSISTSGPSKSEPGGGGGDGEVGKAPAKDSSEADDENWPRALHRRGLKSRLLRIKTNAGYIFTIVSYLIGVFIFATIVGQVGNVITNRNANRLEFERLLDGAKLYMRHHKVPRAMQRRVQRWYDYSWSRGRIQGGGDINMALGLLPDKLKTELALHVNLATLKKVSIFKECQPEFLHDLVLKMKAYIFTPGDLICRKGEVAREMFIIADGILEVISETGKVLTTMKAGDFFGEIGILNLDGLNNFRSAPSSSSGRRTADVRSVGYSELFSLSREDVLTAMKDYPEAQLAFDEILQSLGRKRLMEARHQTSKSGSSGSSKRGTPSPNKDGGPDDKNAKRIVSRIRSDVSAIRNAFRRSKGTTRYMETLEQDNFPGRKTDNETMELEPLTGDHRSSTEDDGPAVKRILKHPSLKKTGSKVIKRVSFRHASLKIPDLDGRKRVSFRHGSLKIPEAAPEGLKRVSFRHTSIKRPEPEGIKRVSFRHTSFKRPEPDGVKRISFRHKSFKRPDSHNTKRISFRKISGRSGSDSSGGGARGVLKRMGHVTSDETNQVVSPGRTSSNEEQGVLGAGLPLLQRLKLLKEKEDKEERERQRIKEEEAKQQEPAPPVEEEPEVIGAGLPLFARLRLLKAKEEKERMEREEKEQGEKEKGKEEDKGKAEEPPKKLVSPVKDQPAKPPEAQEAKEVPAQPVEVKPKIGGGLMKNKLRAAILSKSAPPPPQAVPAAAATAVETASKAEPTTSAASSSSATLTTTSLTTEAPTAGGLAGILAKKAKADAEAKSQVKSPINDLNKGLDTKPTSEGAVDKVGNNNSLAAKDIHANSNSVQGGDALEKAFGKLLSKKLNTAPKEKPISPVIEKPATEVLKLQFTTTKDKINRSDSFKRAMDEGLIRSTDESDLNIKPSEEVKKVVERSKESESEEGKQSSEDKKGGESQSENEVSPVSDSKQIVSKQEIEEGRRKSIDKTSKPESEEGLLRRGSSEKKDSSPVEARRQPSINVPTIQHKKIDSLKIASHLPCFTSSKSNSHFSSSQNQVPSEDVSPPLSSPESTETPERKTLKSILKRMSREDSKGNLLPPDGADLRKLMKAPTVEGFVARRSKFSKSVSFQRKTLSSPPPPALLDELKNSSSSSSSQSQVESSSVPVIPTIVQPPTSLKGKPNDSCNTTDGVSKLMVKLGSIGLDGTADPQTQDLVLGVRKILRDKMDDVEVAWVARVKELQQQLADRDATIRHLTHTISRLQASAMSDGICGETSPENGGSARPPAIIRSPSEASISGSDDDEPLFMRCNSIESIIHQSPDGSPERMHAPLAARRSWPRQSSLDQRSIHPNRFARSLETTHDPNHIILDIGSSTDEDLCSFSSDEDHILFGELSQNYDNEFDEEMGDDDQISEDIFLVSGVDGEDNGDDDDGDDDDENEDEIDDDDAEPGESGETELNSQDWEVQLLARQLAEEQRGVARQVDRDIAEGRLESALAELHEALATDKLGNLTEGDLVRLEKAVRTEREKLRRYARLYSLDERPVLEDQFTSLYRSRSQLLLNRSSELCRAGPTQRRLSSLLVQLTKMTPAEQFLLDRLVYTNARKRKLSRQRSLCEDRLRSQRSNQLLATRRSMSMCSPPPGSTPPTPLRDTASETAELPRDPSSEGESAPPTVSVMLSSLQRSVAAISGRGRTAGNNQGSQKEGAPLLQSPR
ncbi:uncharacterized protein LOC135200888 isoform X2 [Macrobrachium nipponense]|uniref:uncharacterized protein LOC135200888 isoform X2 n=1 Tax=Macrobrachium nipponense TaxID=159736 RepID=UPI0030C83917